MAPHFPVDAEASRLHAFVDRQAVRGVKYAA